ncbi:uncharacterized protein LOC143252366 [Tachypleus tridentatus]|uniref:uncharacterized protein LOC143252366 n=1 Tax=Tachypleus tridentatus TaxID=6853 RepID=UPI003FD38BE9
MTLVLPAFCSNHPPTSNLSLFPESTVISSMPCGFDSEPLDFESVLFSGEWPSSLRDMPGSTQDSDSLKTAPGSSGGDVSEGRQLPSSDNKRKFPRVEEVSVKRVRKEDDVNSYVDVKEEKSDIDPVNTVLVSDLEVKSVDQQLEQGQDEEMPIDDLLLPPRRRVPQLWNTRMRWKDERRKVLKLSMNKLRRIKDPEASLCRSVLINNTVKHLQQEIREEKNGGHRVVGRNNYVSDSSPSPACEPFSPHPSSRSWAFDAEPTDVIPRKSRSDPVSFSSSSSVGEDATNYDEIFCLDEDVLRVDFPSRHSQPQSNGGSVSGQLTSCDSVASCTCTASSGSNSVVIACSKPHSSSHKGKNLDDYSSRRQTASPNPCATEYRINHESYLSDASVLDSVVYQSLLASLES